MNFRTSAAEAAANPLIPHTAELIVGFIAFSLLFLVLRSKVVPMFEKAFAARTKAIQGGMEKAEKAQRDAQVALEQYTAQLSDARGEAQKIREEARVQGAAIIEDLRTKTDDGQLLLGRVLPPKLLKQGITDVNTSSAADLKVVGEQLTALVAATSPKVTITMYTDVPTGQIGLSQMWSGDIINAQNYLPEGATADVLRYWFPADGKGLVDNDLMVLLRAGKNPVLAHLFINHMLATESAKQNFKQIGYQPPQVSMDPDSLVTDGFVAENIKSAIVRPEYFDVGYRMLELDPANDAAWHNVWRAFKAGGS